MVKQGLGDGRMLDVATRGISGKEDLLLDPEMRLLFLLPVREERTGGVGCVFGCRLS